MNYTEDKHNTKTIVEATDRPVVLTESTDYMRGYRTGLRDGAKRPQRFSGDGILGALLAIALMLGLGYLGLNYVRTGSFLPFGVEFEAPVKITPPEAN